MPTCGASPGATVPILVTTSLEDTASIERAYKAGATGFATKPLNWTIEVQRLRCMLRAADTAKALSLQTTALKEQIAAKEKAHAELSEMHEQLVDASRKAGMAEVAAGVLHNIGNILNSINVSTTLLRDNLRNSKVLTLIKVSGLMQEHSADLGTFLTTDPKGKLVPTFVIHLAEILQKEHAALQKDTTCSPQTSSTSRGLSPCSRGTHACPTATKASPSANWLRTGTASGCTAASRRPRNWAGICTPTALALPRAPGLPWSCRYLWRRTKKLRSNSWGTSPR